MNFLRFTLLLASLALSSFSFAALQLNYADTPQLKGSDVILIMSGEGELGDLGQLLNRKTGGELVRQLGAIDIKKDEHQQFVLRAVGEFKRVLVFTVPTLEDPVATDWQNQGGKVVAWLINESLHDATEVLFDITVPTKSSLANWLLGAEMRAYAFNRYKRPEHQQAGLSLTIVNSIATATKTIYEGDLQHVANGVYLARDMATEPGKSVYPEEFVKRVKSQFKGIDNVKFRVLDVDDMTKLNMGAITGVGKGSIHEPKLLVIEYQGGDRDEAPLALVGKGITFDTGGISLKPNNGMWAMKSDLSGAAAVAGTLLAVAKRQEAINVIGLMPLAENMPARDAIRPGDVLNTMQGTSIEIMSTDAEGRLLLADAVYYAQKTYEPKLLVNIATLTGSAARATSDEYAVVITRDFETSVAMMDVGKRSGEHVWPLPLHPNHFKQIRSDIADIKNSGAGHPGASIGAAVVGTFVDEALPWVHLDIAGVDYLTESTDVTPKGAAGWGVRFMDQLVRDHASQ